MGAHMKTTLDIADAVFEGTRALARARGQTLREVVETALRSYLQAQQRPTSKFTLPDASVDGTGLHPDAAGRNWGDILEKSYEGRGG